MQRLQPSHGVSVRDSYVLSPTRPPQKRASTWMTTESARLAWVTVGQSA